MAASARSRRRPLADFAHEEGYRLLEAYAVPVVVVRRFDRLADDVRRECRRLKRGLAAQHGPREAFERDMTGFSMGQKKKVLVAASMARPAHLYLWDEPLNYIDLPSREQIENMLSETEATLLFVEHDRRFEEKIATRRIEIRRK